MDFGELRSIIHSTMNDYEKWSEITKILPDCEDDSLLHYLSSIKVRFVPKEWIRLRHGGIVLCNYLQCHPSDIAGISPDLFRNIETLKLNVGTSWQFLYYKRLMSGHVGAMRLVSGAKNVILESIYGEVLMHIINDESFDRVEHLSLQSPHVSDYTLVHSMDRLNRLKSISLHGCNVTILAKEILPNVEIKISKYKNMVGYHRQNVEREISRLRNPNPCDEITLKEQCNGSKICAEGLD